MQVFWKNSTTVCLPEQLLVRTWDQEIRRPSGSSHSWKEVHTWGQQELSR